MDSQLNPSSPSPVSNEPHISLDLTDIAEAVGIDPFQVQNTEDLTKLVHNLEKAKYLPNIIIPQLLNYSWSSHEVDPAKVIESMQPIWDLLNGDISRVPSTFNPEKMSSFSECLIWWIYYISVQSDGPTPPPLFPETQAHRDAFAPENAASRALLDLPKGAGSVLIVTKYDAANELSPFDAVKELREKHSIPHLDIVVANAGIAKVFPLARDVKRGDIIEHIDVNALSVISLFQATRALLQKSPGKPIFAPIGSGAGALGRQPPVPSSAYGPSKSLLFWYGIRINAEEEWLNTFIVDPGFVQTDMGNDAARRLGFKEDALLTIDESMGSLFQVLRTTTKEKHGDDCCRTPLTESKAHPASPASPVSPTSRHSAPSPSNNSSSAIMKFAATVEELKEARARRQSQELVIELQEGEIKRLHSIIQKQRGVSESLETKLFDSFVVMTQSQQHELDKLQKRLLDLQADAEDWLLGHEWRHLQQKLHDLNRKLDGYIKSSTPQKIAAGEQTDELPLFITGLLGDLPRMWNELEKLQQDIEEEQYRGTANYSDGAEHTAEQTTHSDTSQEEVCSAEMPAHPSVTDILDHYYEFSQLQRKRMAARKERLQGLLDDISTELGRLQADLAYEEGRTANMRTRMMFWEADLGVSKVECPDTLLSNLEMKQTVLKCGSQELEKIAGIIQELPSHFHVIDIRAPGEDRTSCCPTSGKKAPSTLSVDELDENYGHLDNSGDKHATGIDTRPCLSPEGSLAFYKSKKIKYPLAADDDIELGDIHELRLRRLTEEVYNIMSKTKPTIKIRACRDALTSSIVWRVSEAVDLLNSIDDTANTTKSTCSSTPPKTPPMEIKQASRTQNRAGDAGQRDDTLYIAELESKLKEKQDNEKAWATHFENLHQREKEAKTALQEQLDSAKLGNEELQKVVKVVAGKLFEHRERLWGLSTPARKMGEELISTLEQLEISCDEPLIYE
ncbi:hypothetical protein GQX73_g7941 [Xylaria multiplex]|uniref:Uncharacterized protein n=1 Tax=Xylaria multiplex TaxID=323545 RepID=A0A7C8IK13_9PEZI|nr:hypothetical protein GQX73_g7941 [Xylaria multiplex]